MRTSGADVSIAGGGRTRRWRRRLRLRGWRRRLRVADHVRGDDQPDSPVALPQIVGGSEGQVAHGDRGVEARLTPDFDLRFELLNIEERDAHVEVRADISRAGKAAHGLSEGLVAACDRGFGDGLILHRRFDRDGTASQDRQQTRRKLEARHRPAATIAVPPPQDRIARVLRCRP